MDSQSDIGETCRSLQKSYPQFNLNVVLELYNRPSAINTRSITAFSHL